MACGKRQAPRRQRLMCGSATISIMLSLCGMCVRPWLCLPVCRAVGMRHRPVRANPQTMIPFWFLRKGDLQREAQPYTHLRASQKPLCFCNSLLFLPSIPRCKSGWRSVKGTCPMAAGVLSRHSQHPHFAPPREAATCRLRMFQRYQKGTGFYVFPMACG